MSADRPWQDEQTLHYLLNERDLTDGEAADKLGCSRNTILNWREKHDISSGHECPTCGKATFSSQQGMRTHHKMVHGESIAGFTSECANCGDEFTTDKTRDIYCSQECHLTSDRFKEAMSGEKHPFWKGGKVELECGTCGDTYSVDPHEAEGSNYCSYECLYDGIEGPREREECTCQQCGDSFDVLPHKSETQSFCSHACYGDWLSENNRGERHPRWQGGPEPYGPGWNADKKEAVRNRDNRECQDCGMSEETHLDVYGQRHDIHHITPARAFDDPEERNAMSNLITLCARCHREWEKMAPLAPVT